MHISALRSRPLSLALWLGLAAGCGGGPQSEDVSTRFDQRLERLSLVEWNSGDPSVLAATNPERVLDVDFASEIELWNAAGGRLESGPDGVVTAADGRTVTLERRGLDLDLSRVRFLDARFDVKRQGSVAIELFEAGQADEVTRLERPIAARGAFQIGAPIDREGRLTAIRIEVPDGTVLRSLRLGPAPMVPGQSPRVVDSVQLDAGLVALRHLEQGAVSPRQEARRAIPARDGEWQVCTYEAGGSAVLLGAAALRADPRELGGAVRLQVFARRPSGLDPPEDGVLLHELTLDTAADDDRWTSWRVDLPGLEGEEWELLFGAVAEDGSSHDVVAHWAAPILLRRDAPRPPDMVLVTSDTMRADHVVATRRALGLPALAGLETPWMDSVAARGTNFVDALATCNATSPSHASILTGHYVRDHRVTSNDRILSEAATTITELLSERYLCISSVTAGHLNSTVSGLGQGFDIALGAPTIPRTPAPARMPRSLEEIPAFDSRELFAEAAWANTRLMELLVELDEVPVFAWLHYFDPHTPYRVGDDLAHLVLSEEGPGALFELGERRSAMQGQERTADELLFDVLLAKPNLRFLEEISTLDAALSLYAAGVSELDARLAELWEAFETADRDPLVVLTADHGEALGEREIWFEHAGIYDNTLHVPMLVAGPGVEGTGVSRAPASTLDVFPTLAALAGMEAPADLPGRSLFELDPDADRRRWFQHSSEVEAGFREGDRHAVVVGYRHRMGVDDRWREPGTVELWNAQTELPLEPDAAESLRREVEEWVLNPVLDLEAAQAELDDAARAALRALGYTDD